MSYHKCKMSETTDRPTQQQQQDLNSNPMTSQNHGLEESPDKDTPKPKTSLEKYCDENPSASECLIYEE